MTDISLTYSVTSTPSPLQISEMGQVTIVASNSSTKPVLLSQLQVSFHPGTLPKDLAVDFTAARSLSITPNWSFSSHAPGVYLALPQDNQPKVIGRGGLQLMVVNIPVNAAYGTTYVMISEATVVDGKPCVASASYPLEKVEPGLELVGPTVDDPNVDYGMSKVISWAATHGATIEISYDGIIINHIKGQPNAPLPAKGTYELDALDRPQNVVTVKASLNVNGEQTTKLGQITLSLNDPEVTAFSAARVPGAVDKISANWQTKGAETVNVIFGSTEAQQPVQGNAQVSGSLFAVDATLKVTNPAKAISQSVHVGLPSANWVKISNGPTLPAGNQVSMFTAGDKIGVRSTSTGSFADESLVFLSEDALTWTQDLGAPKAGFGTSGFLPASSPKTTFFPGVDVSIGSIFLYRRDVATGAWTKSANSPAGMFGGNTVLFAHDDADTLYWNQVSGPLTGLFASTDQGATWTEQATPNGLRLQSFDTTNSSLVWANGKLWFTGKKIDEGRGGSATLYYVFVPGTGWEAVATTGDLLVDLNAQTTVRNDEICYLHNPFNGSVVNSPVAMELFTLSQSNVIAAHGPSPQAKILAAPTGPELIGMTEFKGALLAFAGPSFVQGSGIWLYSD